MAQANAIQLYVYRQYAGCAAKRGYDFNVSVDMFLELAQGECAYCKAKNTNTANRKQYAVKVWSYNGIDRINSDLPYQAGNIVSCCKACNAAKSDRNLVEFLASEWLKNRIQEVKEG